MTQPTFLSVLLYRYWTNVCALIKGTVYACGYAFGAMFLLMNPIATWAYFWNDQHVPNFFHLSPLVSVWVVNGLMLYNALVALVSLGYFVKDAIKNKTTNIDKWKPLKKPVSGKKKNPLSTALLAIGWIGLLAAIVIGLTLSLMGLVIEPVLKLICSLVWKAGKRVVYNLCHMKEVMEAKNQKFLEDNPEKAAALLRLTLPKAQKDPKKTRL